MFQQLLPLLPADQATTAVVIALIFAALAGLVLWIAGARYSRMVVTLVTVTVGGIAGMLAPRIFGWNVNTMTTSLAGAMLLGLVGFILHGACVGIALIGILSVWAAVGTWIVCHADIPITWPQATKSFTEFYQAVWNQLPETVRSPMPIVIAMAAGLGIIIRFMSPKLALVLAYSLLGVTLIAAAALCAVQTHAITWPGAFSFRSNTQFTLTLATVLLGAFIQLQTLPRKRNPKPANNDE
jgi:hypothetical protein